jgi:hypothetical protein
MGGLVMAMEKRLSERNEAFFRRMTLPQEEGERLTQWCGSFRWFRSENVIALEHYRLRSLEPMDEIKSG